MYFMILCYKDGSERVVRHFKHHDVMHDLELADQNAHVTKVERISVIWVPQHIAIPPMMQKTYE